MKIVYDPNFLKKLKSINVRIRKKVKERILVFANNPNNLELNNHELKKEFQGYRSINITSGWRAIYKETKISDETVAYFVTLGTHKELYENLQPFPSLSRLFAVNCFGCLYYIYSLHNA